MNATTLPILAVPMTVLGKSYATKANLLNSEPYKQLCLQGHSRGRHLICRKEDGRWTAVIIGPDGNQGWLASGRVFLWVA